MAYFFIFSGILLGLTACGVKGAPTSRWPEIGESPTPTPGTRRAG